MVRPVPGKRRTEAAKSDTAKIVAGQPSASRTGLARVTTDVNASSNVTATRLARDGASTASENVVPW